MATIMRVNNVIFRKQDNVWVSDLDKMSEDAFQRHVSRANSVQILDEPAKKRPKKVVVVDVPDNSEEKID